MSGTNLLVMAITQGLITID